VSERRNESKEKEEERGRGREEGDSPIGTRLNSFGEGGVDILDENEASIGYEGENLLKTVVRETSFGEIEEADVVGDETGESLDVRRFP